MSPGRLATLVHMSSFSPWRTMAFKAGSLQPFSAVSVWNSRAWAATPCFFGTGREGVHSPAFPHRPGPKRYEPFVGGGHVPTVLPNGCCPFQCILCKQTHEKIYYRQFRETFLCPEIELTL